MAVIDKKLIHFKTTAEFNKRLKAGDLKDTSIVFVKEANYIWTHGNIYYCNDVSDDLNKKLDKTEKGAASGVASLDSKGKLAESQIPQDYKDSLLLTYKLVSKIDFRSDLKYIEKGVSSDIRLAWEYFFNDISERPDTMKLVSGGSTLTNGNTTFTYTGKISDTKTYQVIVTKKGAEIKKDLTVEAFYPKYVGWSPKTSLVGSDITGFAKQPISPDAKGSFEINMSENTYLWVCIPSDMTLNAVESFGFEVPMEKPITVSVSGKGTYSCYRSSKLFKVGQFKFNVM